jgi:hypothetical protein
MPVLKNSRWEKFAQLRGTGMMISPAYVAAGFKPNQSNASRLNRNELVRARIEELQGNSADQIADVRDLARKHTAVAVETLAEIMNDIDAPKSARVQAATSILDRGWGKAPQTIEMEPTPYDSLTLDQRQSFALALRDFTDDASAESGDASGSGPTKH